MQTITHEEEQTIIRLLCSSQPENIELAEQICKGYGIYLTELIEKYGYRNVGITFPDDFLKTKIEIRRKNIQVFPERLPESLLQIICVNSGLNLISSLPSNLRLLEIWSNQITMLPNLPNSLEYLDCSENLLCFLPDKLPRSLTTLFCYSNNLAALPVLPQNIQELDICDNLITELQDMPLSIKSLYFANNKIDKFPKIPSTLEYVHYFGNPLQMSEQELKKAAPLCELYENP